MKKTDDFPYYMTRFFESYLPGSRNVSGNTILSYRDTFSKLLVYMRDNRSIEPDKVRFKDLDNETIGDFLAYLEDDQKCSLSTRNQRLASLKSFFRFVEVERPDLLLQCQSIIAIRNKSAPKPVIEYLDHDEMKLLLEQPDRSSHKGRRDLAILELMYDSAARVQEICDLNVRDVKLKSSPIIRVFGKGRKTRDIPLDGPCVDTLRNYMNEYHLNRTEMLDTPLFFNNRHEKLSRSGISFILSKYIERANENGGSISKKITPHCIRHTKAMHMVEAGINLIYIRDFLGHESIDTTQVYAKANPEVRRNAINKMSEKVSASSSKESDWNDDPGIMDFLHGIRK